MTKKIPVGTDIKTPQNLVDAIWLDAEGLFVNLNVVDGKLTDSAQIHIERIFEALDEFAINNGLNRPIPFGTSDKRGGCFMPRKYFGVEYNDRHKKTYLSEAAE